MTFYQRTYEAPENSCAMKIHYSVFLSSFLFAFINCSGDNPTNQSQEQEQIVTDSNNPDTDQTQTETAQTDTTATENTTTIDISKGLMANDLENHPMQDIAKPAYLATIIDPSFGTKIRRISNAEDGQVIKPMYSTIQAWNADETYMILYDQGNGVHQLLNGLNYSFIRNLDDVHPDDLEQIFWDFNDPDVFYYLDRASGDLIKYGVSRKTKDILVNLGELSACHGSIGLGNDVQMMSWDSDLIGFRCDNSSTYAYRISTEELISFEISDVQHTAPMPLPSGERFYHGPQIYDDTGSFKKSLNESKTEHSSLGRLVDGTDAHFAIAFSEGPEGGCIGDIIAHNIETGECFPVISQNQGYEYPQSGTHISGVSHKNQGWVAASMMGYDQDGQTLLDQELVIARVEKDNVQVYRIGHHRSDEEEFDYWGEPHAVISPTGSRVLFGSDWSGYEDGKSVDSYVVELPAFN